MFFRNLHLFRFSEACAATLRGLDDVLPKARLRELGPLEQSTRGFVSPHGQFGDVLTHCVADFTLFAVGEHAKLLPSGVVNGELARRLHEIAEREQRRVGAKERKRIKDEVVTDLLPRAFVSTARTFGYVDLADGWLIVDTASRRRAEDMVTALRDALGSLPVAPMAPEESARTLMTDWVSRREGEDGSLPAGFGLGDEIELRDLTDGGAVVRCRRQELESYEILEHLRGGKTVTALALTFDDRISFVLDEDLVIRKLRFLDQVLDELGETQTDSVAAELDARMALMTLEVRRLLKRLDEIFGIPRPTEQ